MAKHNYTNAAFCQSSEFCPIFSENINDRVEFICNRSSQSNFDLNATLPSNSSSHIHPNLSKVKRKVILSPTSQRTGNRRAGEKYFVPDNYSLVSVEGLHSGGGIVSNISPIKSNDTLWNRRQNSFHKYNYNYVNNTLEEEKDEKEQKNKTNSFCLESAKTVEPFSSLPVTFDESLIPTTKKRRISTRNYRDAQDNECKMGNVFASNFNSKSFVLVDKNTNQCYQMVPTSENEELVDDNREIIQMHNGQTHRYAIIPTDKSVNDHLSKDAALEEGENEDKEKESCLSNNDLLNTSEQFKVVTTNSSSNMKNASSSMINLSSYSKTPMRNPIATKMLYDLLSTPSRNNIIRESVRSYSHTPRNFVDSSNTHRDLCRYQGMRNLPPILSHKNSQLSLQRSHYESIKSHGDKGILDKPPHYENDYTTAVVQPRVDTMRSELPLQLAEEEYCHSNGQHQKDAKNMLFYPRKLAQATITLAIISLMLVLSSSMNLGLILYMIAHLGKTFYLQFSLVAAICGVGLGILGFRSRHCEWLPNRSYISGYVLVTMFCLLKCCSLLVIIILDPYPGLPLHDVTTGIILGLSTFTMFFIGLGVIGSLCCYHPPPDNRINVV